MTAYYNENDPFAADWLRLLIAVGAIAPGDVDERSIEDVPPDDLQEYSQCHFFAGIGGWSHALRLAGWPDDRPVWTGSCPCQPYSAAGARGGADDPRNLWWAFRWLIAQREPPVVFGEQVASKDGRAWLAGVRADLEALGYGVGAADLCAASVGAPHIRQRLWWVADADGGQSRHGHVQSGGEHGQRAQDSGAGGMEHTARDGRQEWGSEPGGRGVKSRCESGWSASVAIPCSDGRSRRIEPDSFPLAHGVPARVGRLRGYGNAIVPQVAAEVIKCVM